MYSHASTAQWVNISIENINPHSKAGTDKLFPIQFNWTAATNCNIVYYRYDTETDPSYKAYVTDCATASADKQTFFVHVMNPSDAIIYI